MADEDMGLSSQQNKTLLTGHEGAGSDCLGKSIYYGWKGLLIGGSVGTVEGCFINPVPGSTTPMLVRALGLIVGRAALGATVGGVFASAACVSAGLRDRDDYQNAFIGGAAAGSVFGFASRRLSLGLLMGFSLGVTMAMVKYRHGTYFPSLPSQEVSPQQLPLNRPSTPAGDD